MEKKEKIYHNKKNRTAYWKEIGQLKVEIAYSPSFSETERATHSPFNRAIDVHDAN